MLSAKLMPSILMKRMDLSDCVELEQMNIICHVAIPEDSHVLPSHGGSNRSCRLAQCLEGYCTRCVVRIASSGWAFDIGPRRQTE